MKVNVSVICAHAPHLNTGMISVDLSIKCFMDAVFGSGDYDVRYYNVEEFFEVGRKEKIAYEFFEQPKEIVSKSDYVFYWGDFLHSRNYIRAISKRVSDRQGVSVKEASNFIFKRLFLEDVSASELGKVIVFGGALHLNSISDDFDARYYKSISRLYSHARRIVCRDPISIFYAASYSRSQNVSPVGIDPAFFLTHEKYGLKTIGKKNGRVGWTFGRTLNSKKEYRSSANKFCQELAKAQGCQLSSIGWFEKNVDDPTAGYFDKINKIIECDVVVTDIYHCAVNSINSGVPVVLIGDPSDFRKTNTLNDKKKEFLFYYLNCVEFYFDVGNLQRESFKKTVGDISQKLSSDYFLNVKVRLDEIKLNVIEDVKRII